MAELEELQVEIVETCKLHELRVKYDLEDQIRQAQKKCNQVAKMKKLMAEGKIEGYRLDERGTLWFKDRICVPRTKLRQTILDEAHTSKYSIHPGCTKMYKDLKTRFWWKRMRRDIASYVAHCDTCRRVKAEHQRPAGLL